MKQISEDIKTGSFRKVYLLHGEERYLRIRMQQQLVAALMPEEDGMNFSRFTGKETAEETVILAGETLPFFVPRRVILVEDSGFFKEKTEKLADFVKELPDYLVLVFSETEIDKRGRLYKAVAKAGHVAAFETQKEEVIMKWVLGRLKREGRQIRRGDLEHFLSLVGSDMGTVDCELEKLLCYTMDRDVITRADIDAVVTPQISNRIFDMVRAVTNREQKRALDLYYDLLALKEPPMRILYLLAREFNILYQVRALADAGEGSRAIAERLGIPPFAVQRSQSLARRYERRDLKRAVADFVRTETDVKTGKLEDKLSVELMIVKYSGA